MRFLYPVIFGLALGVASVTIYNAFERVDNAEAACQAKGGQLVKGAGTSSTYLCVKELK